MSWIYLLIEGIFEVVWATTMKLSNGFSILSYLLAMLVGIAISLGSLVLAPKNLSLSIASPRWTSIGVVGAIIVGVVLFHDQFSAVTWIFVAMLVVSIIGIKMTTGH